MQTGEHVEEVKRVRKHAFRKAIAKRKGKVDDSEQQRVPVCVLVRVPEFAAGVQRLPATKHLGNGQRKNKKGEKNVETRFP